MNHRHRQVLDLLKSVWQAGRLYSSEHPQFIELLDKMYLLISEILKETRELTLAIMDEDVVMDEEIMINYHRRMPFLFQGLRDRSIERLTFYSGLDKEELIKFFSFIFLPQKRSEQDLLNFFQLEGIKHIVAGKLKVPFEEERKPEFAFSPDYKRAFELVGIIAAKLSRQEKISPLDLKYFALSIFENFSSTYWQELNQWPTIPPTEKLWAHLLNTSLLVMVALNRLGYPREDILDLGVAALFHDIGKISSLDLGAQTGENHMLNGARILIKYKESLSPFPAIVALEHHLRYDLKGQPELKGIREPNEASQLVSIANIYDHLLRKWIYHERFDPLFVYNLMMSEKGKVFSPEWLDQFFQVMGVWPEGCEVILSDGRKGRVVGQSKNEPLRPRVEVSLPQEGVKVVDLSQDKKVSIVGSVNPFFSH